MILYIGNKNYSSWSMRPWVMLRQAGIAFDEVMLRLEAFSADSHFKQRLGPISPAGKVLGQLKSPDRAQANLVWGGPDLKTAYIMAAGNVYKLPILIPGEKPLYTK